MPAINVPFNKTQPFIEISTGTLGTNDTQNETCASSERKGKAVMYHGVLSNSKNRNEEKVKLEVSKGSSIHVLLYCIKFDINCIFPFQLVK